MDPYILEGDNLDLDSLLLLLLLFLRGGELAIFIHTTDPAPDEEGKGGDGGSEDGADDGEGDIDGHGEDVGVNVPAWKHVLVPCEEDGGEDGAEEKVHGAPHQLVDHVRELSVICEG